MNVLKTVAKIFRRPGLLLFMLAVLGTEFCGAVTELRTTAQDAFPKYFKEKGQMMGICPMILKALEAIDPNLKFVGYNEFLPTKRIESELRQGKLDAFACFAPSEERKTYIEFIEPPLFVNAVRVAALKSSPAAQVKSWSEMLTHKDWVFMATLGTPHVEFLQSFAGIKVDPGGGDNKSNLDKLLVHRGDVFVHFGFILDAMIKKEHLQDRVVILPFDVRMENQYFVTTKKLPKTTRERITKAVKKLVKSGEIKKIYRNYIDE